MKHRLLFPVAVVALLLTACAPTAVSNSSGNEGDSSKATTAPEETQAPPAEPLDLTGEWRQTNSKSAEAFQTATITTDRIEIDWVNDTESTTAIYWAGTYVPPTEDIESYSWDSQADTAALENALLASQDATKAFTYQNGVLSYELTAMGVSMTVEMKRE